MLLKHKKMINNKKISLILPDDSYLGIGIVVTQYGQIETLLEHIIWLLLGMNSSQGRLITSSMSIQPRLKLLEGLAKLKDNSLAPKIKALKKPIVDAFEKRAVIVHGLWFLDPETQKTCCTLTREKASSVDLQKVHIFTSKNLVTLCKLLTKIVKELDNLKSKLEKNN